MSNEQPRTILSAIPNDVISFRNCQNKESSGGALFVGGDLVVLPQARLRVRNCSCKENGGGIYVDGAFALGIHSGCVVFFCSYRKERGICRASCLCLVMHRYRRAEKSGCASATPVPVGAASVPEAGCRSFLMGKWRSPIAKPALMEAA